MATKTQSIAGRAHGAAQTPTQTSARTTAAADKEYRPQLTGLPGVHPEVARAVQTAFDNLYELRAQVQGMSASAGAATATAGGAGKGAPAAGSDGAAAAKAGPADNILGLKYKAGTDPASLAHGAMTTYNATTGQFEFATPAGFVTPPGTSTATGTAGQIAHDGTSAYFCVGPNQWKKATLSSF